MRSVFVAADSAVLHARRTCSGLVASQSPIEVIAEAGRRARMFDRCPLCAGGRRPERVPLPAAGDPLLDRPPSTRERVRAEAIRRGMTYHEWANRFVATAPAASAPAVVDLVAAERVVDLRAAERQSVNVTS